MPERELTFHQFLRPLVGIGLPLDNDSTKAPDFEYQLIFDKNTNKFLLGLENNEGVEDFKWATLSRVKSVTQIDNHYNLKVTDYIILVDSTDVVDLKITLPLASEAIGNIYNIKRINGGNNKIVVETTNNEFIDGYNTPLTIELQYVNMTLVSNGMQWYII